MQLAITGLGYLARKNMSLLMNVQLRSHFVLFNKALIMENDSKIRQLGLLIFDCDGVLVDSEHISQRVLNEMLREMGIKLTKEETSSRFIGSSISREKVADLIGKDPPLGFLEEYLQRTQDAFLTELTPVSGIEGVLSWLPIPYCVASNGSRAKMVSTLSHVGLLSRFKTKMFSAEDVQNPKPAPDIFLYAAQCNGIDPVNCIVIEDSPIGVAAARAAGMQAFGFAARTSTDLLFEAGAHVVFSKMSELPSLLC